jgi:hypothetical protein
MPTAGDFQCAAVTLCEGVGTQSNESRGGPSLLPPPNFAFSYVRFTTVSSTGHCNTARSIGRGFESQGLARALIEP